MTDLALPSWVNPRADWGARHARGARPAPLPAQGVYLHHTGMDAQPSDTATSRQVEDVGQARFRYGTSYTFLIHRSGRVDEGHGVEREGTHTVQRLPNGTTRSLNRTHRGICWPGNYQHDRPTPAQIESTARLVAHGILVGWWTRPLVGGHRDIAATACPGDHAYPLIP